MKTISCTGLIHTFVEDFESNLSKPDKWAERQGHFYKAKSMADRSAHKRNFYPKEGDPYGRPDYSRPKPVSECVTEEQVKNEWLYKNHHATYEGSVLHDYIENYLSNRIFPYPKESPEGLKFEEIKETFEIMRKQFIDFYEKAVRPGHLIPIRSELVVGDSDYGITGMVDQLFWSTKHNEFQIWDWKTNTVLNMDNKYGNKMSHILSDLDDCEYNTYSLQLGVYKHIIEKNTKIKIGRCFLVWFNEENENFKVIKTKNFDDRVKEMIDFKIENPSLFH